MGEGSAYGYVRRGSLLSFVSGLRQLAFRGHTDSKNVQNLPPPRSQRSQKPAQCRPTQRPLPCYYYREITVKLAASLRPPILPIRRCAIRRRTAPPRTCPAPIDIRRCIPLLTHIIPSATVHHPPTATVVGPAKAITSASTAIATAAFELLQHGSEFLLHDFDALLHDGVGLEAADGFDFEVEFGGVGVVVEGGAVGGGIFPGGVFGLGPGGCFRVLG